MSLNYLLLVFFFVTLLTSNIFGDKLKIIGKKITKLPSPKNQPLKIDLCPFCVSFFDTSLDELLEIILNIESFDSCIDLCRLLPNQMEEIACKLLCDYIGVDNFLDLLSYEDPDSIYLCQLSDICPVINGGQVTALSITVSPSSGPLGTIFNFNFIFQVLNFTGPGYITIFILPPSGFPLIDKEFIQGQAPGKYSSQWSLQAQPNEQQPFSTGIYQSLFFVCEGDCTTSHPWAGIYTQTQKNFTVTN